MHLVKPIPFALLLFCLAIKAPAQEVLDTKADPQGLLPLNDLRTFTEIFDRIKQAYVEEVDDKTLFENAVQGMLQGLDPHSAYLESDAFEDLQMNTTGEFGGLGIEVEMEAGFIKVVAPIDDTPAMKAGIQPQDLIIKIDDQPLKGLGLQEAVELMRGEPGSIIRLTIARESESVPFEIELERAVIKVQSVRSRTLAPGFGYLRITQFQIKTGTDLVAAIERLKAEHKPLKGLVLDLRNNPGGILNAAVEVSDAFLDQGLIVYTTGRIPNSDLRYNATKEDPSEGIPLVVLINGGSASASEIVAGALQDHSRAIILGTNSFGKGSVQTVLPLNNDRALKLTTALYYTPNGRSIQAEGIVPDILVDSATATLARSQPLLYKEADLPRHLNNANQNGGGQGEQNADAPERNPDSADQNPGAARTQPQTEDEPANLAATDFQLYEALNLLKGISVLKTGEERRVRRGTL